MTASGSDIKIYDNEEATKVTGIKLAEFSSWTNIKCTSTAENFTYWLYAYDETFYKRNIEDRVTFKDLYLVKEGRGSGSSFNITLPHTAHINIVYSIESLDDESKTGMRKIADVTFDKLYDDARFEKYYTYSGKDLGATYSTEKTTFKVWAPTAANMTLLLYEQGATYDYGGSNLNVGYHMNYTGHGVWSLTVQGNLMNRYYTYRVDNSLGTQETIDPYAKASGLNGVRGYIFNDEYCKPAGWSSLPLVWDGTEDYDIKTPQELTIYEVHVQDFTGDESWNGKSKRGTFSAFVESGTYVEGHKDIPTGYDHLNELGVSAVQLLPVFDHDNDETKPEDYNWGYNPLNYNCIEGAYTNDPRKPNAGISEFRKMILELSKTKAHTRVIMDVVYNHVSRASASCFTKLMPKYYFRYNAETGEYENGSGCSNEIRSEATMMRKYIVDSVVHWATNFKIKGFRFDLMGLIDVDTMRAVKEALYAIDPDIYVYGEGWTSIEGYHGKGVAGASTANLNSLYDSSTSHGFVGGFNDKGRDALRGGNDAGWGSSSSLPGWGFLQKGHDADYDGRDNVAKMIWGINGNGLYNPKQNIAYASCHDNWTVFDQMYYTLGDTGSQTAPTYKRVMEYSVVAHALVMVANSASFILGGEEIFRTKELKTQEERDEVTTSTYECMYGRYVSHNSYNSPLSVNSFKWGNKVSAYGVDTTAYNEEFKKVIALHKQIEKLPYAEPYPYTTTTKGNAISNISWNGHNPKLYDANNNPNSIYNGAAGFQFDEYFIFAAGRFYGYVPSNATSWTVLYSYGNWKHGNNSVDLGYDGEYSDPGVGGAVVIFKR